MTQELNLNNLIAAAEIAKAAKMIRDEKLDRIYCSLTGVEVGSLSDSEILHCLAVDAELDSFVSAEDMVEEFANRQALMSSGPAPSLRVYRTRNVLLSVLKADATGPNRLFGYLAGRLFFESIVADRNRDSFELLKSKLAFLVELQGNLSALGAGWHKSLTHQDEAPTQPSEKAINVLEISFGVKAPEVNQAKMAQRCLESLIRIDGVFNLRSKIYSAKIMERLETFRDESNIDFTDLLAILEELESDAIIRTDKTKRIPESNSQIVTLALEAIGWQERRITRLADIIDEATAKRRISTHSTAAHLISSLSAILEASRFTGTIKPKEKMKLESTILTLERELETTGQRIEKTVKLANRINADSGKVQIRRGEKPLLELVDLFKSQGKALSPVLKIKADQLASRQKAAAAAKGKKPVTRKTGRPLTIRTHSALSDLFKGLNIPTLPGSDSDDKE